MSSFPIGDLAEIIVLAGIELGIYFAPDLIEIGTELGIPALQSIFKKNDDPPINFINVMIVNGFKKEGSKLVDPVGTTPFILMPRNKDDADGDDSDLYSLKTCEGHRLNKKDFFPLVGEKQALPICRVGGDSGDDPAQGAFQYVWRTFSDRYQKVPTNDNAVAGLWNIEYKIDGKNNEFRVRYSDSYKRMHTDTVEVHYSDAAGENIDGILSGHEVFAIVYFGLTKNDIREFSKLVCEKNLKTEHGKKLLEDCKKMLQH